MPVLNKWILALMVAVTFGCQAEQDNAPVGAAATPPKAVQQAAPAAPTPVTANYVEGTHYEMLSQQVPTANADIIEITEVFWYGCGHCFDFEPMLESWAEALPADVVLVRSPAIWDQQGIMERHARIYYTAKALGVLDRLHIAAFEEMNLNRNELQTEDAIAELFEDNGVSSEDFAKTFNSFGVTSAVKQAQARLRGYRTQGTPEIVVNGTYRVSSRMAGSHQGMLNVTSFLIDKVKSEQ